MQAAAGTSIWGGIAIGKIHIYHRPERHVSAAAVTDPNAEIARYQAARERVRSRQKALYDKTQRSAGKESAAIFEFHAGMLDDDKLTDAIEQSILEGHHTAEYAVRESFETAAARFRDVEDPYFRARREDVLDVGNMLIDALQGTDASAVQGEEPYILVADNLAPSETAGLDPSLILGIVIRQGTPASHTAILARAMNIPALIQCANLSMSWEGRHAILDGYNSCIYIEPSATLEAKLQKRYDEDMARRAALQNLKGQPSTTLDGRTIKVYANISGPQDIGAVEQNDAEGIGLFRSEFVYLRSTTDPTEEMQYQAYREVLKTLSPRRVIIRTCDIGADKSVSYLDFGKETNPALGCRGIRISLSKPEFFKRQLRALLRASVYGRLGIMFPMITSTKEVTRCREFLKECRRELEREKLAYDENIPIGIMVETPAAVLQADELAGMVDFFSIGTNDLTQYTLAVDRQNAMLGEFSDPHHPAVLQEIEMTIAAGHLHGIPVGICGELAADPEMTETLLRMGVDELSVNPTSVLPLRSRIRSLNLSQTAK